MNEDVFIVKMVSGESFVASVETSDERNTIDVNFPMCVMHNESNEVVFVPWIYSVECMTEKGLCRVNPASIVSIVTPFNDLKNAYLEFKSNAFSNIIKPTPEEAHVILN